MSSVKEEEVKEEIKYFECSSCTLKEKYEYFGNSPPYAKDYKLKENAYVIEDPFIPPKRGQFLVLGSHCTKCNKVVCKNTGCSIFFCATYCIKCAKEQSHSFPTQVQEKLNRIVIPT